MTTIITELGKKLAERWVALLLLPGVLFLAVGTIAYRLGQTRATDVGEAVRWLEDVGQRASSSIGTVILALVVIFILAATIGYLVELMVPLILRMWTLRAQRGVARGIIALRGRRWDRAQRRIEGAILAVARGELGSDVIGWATAKRNAVGMRRPRRVTWMGDRLSAMDSRLYDAYDIDIQSVWSRIWIYVSEEVRSQLGKAQQDVGSAARVTAWGVLYLLVAAVWWPAATIGVAVIFYGVLRGRRSVDVLSELVEATVDVHIGSLGAHLGVHAGKMFDRVAGNRLSAVLRKD